MSVLLRQRCINQFQKNQFGKLPSYRCKSNWIEQLEEGTCPRFIRYAFKGGVVGSVIGATIGACNSEEEEWQRRKSTLSERYSSAFNGAVIGFSVGFFFPVTLVVGGIALVAHVVNEHYGY